MPSVRSLFNRTPELQPRPIDIRYDTPRAVAIHYGFPLLSAKFGVNMPSHRRDMTEALQTRLEQLAQLHP